MRFLAIVFSAIGVSCAVPSLHPAISDVRKYCNEQMDCIDGNRKDVKGCIVSIQNSRRLARQYGCQSEYAEYVSCIKDEGECNGESWDHDCFDELEDYWECLEDESDIYEGY